MMKPILLCLLGLKLTAVCAVAQTCERTLAVGSMVPVLLQAGDVEVTLGKQALTITKIEPLRSMRVLIVLGADPARLTHDKDFQRAMKDLTALDAIPKNVTMTYAAAYEKQTALSGPFTSDPQELRNNLQKVVAGTFSQSYPREDLTQALNFFGQPQPGDTVVVLVNHWSRVLMPAEAFLERGVRVFSVALDYDPGDPTASSDSDTLAVKVEGGRYDDLPGPPAETTGGHRGFLASPKSKQENRFWMFPMPPGYMITVAIPAGVQTKQWTWHVGIAKPTVERLRANMSSVKHFYLEYPDLLLCDPAAKPRVVEAVRPRFQ